MRKPNLFIIGAPKCGTTSLARWLSTHPEVFLSPRKEPQYFNYDYGRRRYKLLSDYEALFQDATSSELIIAEASTRYLYSNDAVPAIKTYNPSAKFIVLVRNPLEMVVSLHEQIFFDGDESEDNFEKAWRLQAVRKNNKKVPLDCIDPQILQYGVICKLGEQVERLLNHVDRKDVHIINFDSLKNQPQQVYSDVLKFLDLNHDGRSDFPAFNRAKVRRFRLLWRIVRMTNILWVEAGLPEIRTGFSGWFNSKSKKERPRSTVEPELKSELKKYYAEDVELLSSLTGWDLSHWMR